MRFHCATFSETDMLAKTCSHRWLFSDNTFALCRLLDAEKQGASSETGEMLKPATARWLLEPTYQEMGSLFTHINKQHWLWRLSKGKWSCGAGGRDLTVYGYKTCENLGMWEGTNVYISMGNDPPKRKKLQIVVKVVVWIQAVFPLLPAVFQRASQGRL